MSYEAFTRLLENFGRALGVDDLNLDGDGYCALSFDDVIVHFQFEDRYVTIFSRVGGIDQDRLEGISAMLLAANIFWQGTKGATFSIDPDAQAVFIADRKPVDQISDALFNAWLQDFVNITEYWVGRLDSANKGGPLFETSEKAPSPHDDPGIEFMTRV